METQDILNMLNNLEQSLQNVESARQQVTNTVNAYEGAKSQLHALTVEFNEVSSELNKVYNAIRENVDSIDKTLQIKVNSIFNSISKKVETLESTAEKIQYSFEKSCNSSVNTIENSVDNSIERLNKEVDQSIAKFNEKVKFELERISSILSNLKSGTKEIQESFRNSNSIITSDLKVTLGNVAKDFQTSINDHISSFTRLKEELKAIINGYEKYSETIIDKIESLETLVKGETTTLKAEIKTFIGNQNSQYDDIITKLKFIYEENGNLFERINTVDAVLKDILSSISELKSQIASHEMELLNKIDKLSEEVTNSRKLLIFSLIAIIISVLLNLIAFIK